MASFVLSFFPLDVLDEIWDLIESVSGGFLTYSFIDLRLKCLIFRKFENCKICSLEMCTTSVYWKFVTFKFDLSAKCCKRI